MILNFQKSSLFVLLCLVSSPLYSMLVKHSPRTSSITCQSVRSYPQANKYKIRPSDTQKNANFKKDLAVPLTVQESAKTAFKNYVKESLTKVTRARLVKVLHGSLSKGALLGFFNHGVSAIGCILGPISISLEGTEWLVDLSLEVSEHPHLLEAVNSGTMAVISYAFYKYYGKKSKLSEQEINASIERDFVKPWQEAKKELAILAPKVKAAREQLEDLVKKL